MKYLEYLQTKINKYELQEHLLNSNFCVLTYIYVCVCVSLVYVLHLACTFELLPFLLLSFLTV